MKFDIPSWGGFILTVVIAALAGLIWLIRTVKASDDDGGETELVKELKAHNVKLEARVEDLERDLRSERDARETDRIRSDLALNALRQEIDVLRGQLNDAYRNRLPRNGDPA